MSIDDLKQRIHDLRQLQEAIMDMNYHIEIAVDEALHTLEDKLSDLGVTI